MVLLFKPTGSSFFLLIGSEDYVNWFFQWVFAGTTTTIVSGAVAERCRFRAYLIYSIVLSGFIYPIVCHWIWDSNGLLYGKVLDFSGSGAVHLVGGAAGKCLLCRNVYQKVDYRRRVESYPRTSFSVKSHGR